MVAEYILPALLLFAIVCDWLREPYEFEMEWRTEE